MGEAYCINWIIDFEDVEDEEGARPVDEAPDDSSKCCREQTHLMLVNAAFLMQTQTNA